MSANIVHPELQTRGYGPSGLDRYETVPWPQMFSAGDKEFGKARIDCGFLFEKSLWGVFTPNRHPGGIVYLDFGFKQSEDYRLKSATVTVKLDEDHCDLARERGAFMDPGAISATFLNRGPEEMCGAENCAHYTKHRTGMPHAEALGCGFGGVGGDSETERNKKFRWDLDSHLYADHESRRNRSGMKILEWTLTENKLDPQPLHSSSLHTAFSFQHDGQPFFMHVSISGQLRGYKARMKDGFDNMVQLFKFGSTFSNSPRASILVNFGEASRFSTPLDEISKKLDVVMRRVNRDSAPAEIPNSTPYTPREGSSLGGSTAVPSPKNHRSERHDSNTDSTDTRHATSGQNQEDANSGDDGADANSSAQEDIKDLYDVMSSLVDSCAESDMTNFI